MIRPRHSIIYSIIFGFGWYLSPLNELKDLLNFTESTIERADIFGHEHMRQLRIILQEARECYASLEKPLTFIPIINSDQSGFQTTHRIRDPGPCQPSYAGVLCSIITPELATLIPMGVVVERPEASTSSWLGIHCLESFLCRADGSTGRIITGIKTFHDLFRFMRDHKIMDLVDVTHAFHPQIAGLRLSGSGFTVSLSIEKYTEANKSTHVKLSDIIYTMTTSRPITEKQLQNIIVFIAMVTSTS